MSRPKNEERERIKGVLDVYISSLLKAKEIKADADASKLNVTQDFKLLSEICLRAREQFMSEPVLLRLAPPICVLGDLHGQFLDLQKMIEYLGMPPKQRYLFLGDYVDRGAYSIETVTLLLAMKLRYPKHLFMIRGNHETRAVNKIYGFFEECRKRFPEDANNTLWTLYQHVFNCMPMSALIADKIFCTHGGISEDLLSFKQYERIVRPTDVTDLGLLTDLLWADPLSEPKRYEISPRGISMLFGTVAMEEFCNNLGVELIVRGHQAVQNGWEFSSDRRCLTIFSAPAYCGEQDNLAAVLTVSRQLECVIYTFKGVNPLSAATKTVAAANEGEKKAPDAHTQDKTADKSLQNDSVGKKNNDLGGKKNDAAGKKNDAAGPVASPRKGGSGEKAPRKSGSGEKVKSGKDKQKEPNDAKGTPAKK